MATPVFRNVDRARLRGLIDIDAVAVRLGVQVRHVRRLVYERRIPFVKWGHLIRFDPLDIEEWLNARRRPTQSEPSSDRNS